MAVALLVPLGVKVKKVRKKESKRKKLGIKR